MKRKDFEMVAAAAIFAAEVAGENGLSTASLHMHGKRALERGQLLADMMPADKFDDDDAAEPEPAPRGRRGR